MVNNFYEKDLDLACNTRVSSEAMFVGMDDEIEILQEYLGKKFNNLEISKELKDRVSEINFSESDGFKDWFEKRVDFYKSDWDNLTKNEEKTVNDYIFLSETFKILNECSWWVQNAYQSDSGGKDLLNNLDCIAARLEKDDESNKIILIGKVDKYCNKKSNLHGKSSKDCSDKQNEKERQIFAFFAELKVTEELNNNEFKNIKFIQEQQSIKTPDLSAKKDGLIYYIEVKRLQNPREEDNALRSTGQHRGDVNSEFRGPVCKKIVDFICDAKEKFKDIENRNVKINKEQKILVIDFEPGIDARLNDNFSNSKLESVFGKDYFSDLKENHDMQIWTRKYF